MISLHRDKNASPALATIPAKHQQELCLVFSHTQFTTATSASEKSQATLFANIVAWLSPAGCTASVCTYRIPRRCCWWICCCWWIRCPVYIRLCRGNSWCLSLFFRGQNDGSLVHAEILKHCVHSLSLPICKFRYARAIAGTW